jgi:hypothetical protein
MNSEHTQFSGADWQTNRRSLAQLLLTLDGMQAFTYGMAAGRAMPESAALCFDIDAESLDEKEQLRVLGELARDALAEADFLAADLEADDVPARIRWSLVEARQLLFCVRELASEAREALNYKNMDDVPAAVVMEFADNLRRVKMLLTGLDEASSGAEAA